MGVIRGYIPRESLKHLRNYQYRTGQNVTPLERVMNVFWDYTVSLLPKWLAPNAITLIGFVCACSGFLLMSVYAPTSTEAAPRVVYLIVALLYWIYQTLDAIDGKQARRTKSSSALGTLFDHGCDIFTAITLSFVVVMATRAGQSSLVFWVIMLSSEVCQFLMIWWEYYFHVFFVNFAHGVGVTEAQLAIQLLLLFNFVFGSNFWSFSISHLLPGHVRSIAETAVGGQLMVRHILIFLLCANNFATSAYTVLAGLWKIPSLNKKFEASTQLLGFGCFLLAEWRIYSSALVERQITSQLVIHLIITFSYAISAIRLLLSSFCKRRYLALQWPVLPIYALAAFFHFGSVFSTDPLLARYAIWAVLAWQAFYAVDFLRTSVHDICDALDIYCFRIQPLTADVGTAAKKEK